MQDAPGDAASIPAGPLSLSPHHRLLLGNNRGVAGSEQRTGRSGHESTVALVRSPRRPLLVALGVVVAAVALVAVTLDGPADDGAQVDAPTPSPAPGPTESTVDVASDATRGLVLDPVPPGWVRTAVHHHPWTTDFAPALAWSLVLAEGDSRRSQRVVGIEAHPKDPPSSPATTVVERDGRRFGVEADEDLVQVTFEVGRTGQHVQVRSFTESLEHVLDLAEHVEATSDGIDLVDRDGTPPPLHGLEPVWTGPAPPSAPPTRADGSTPSTRVGYSTADGGADFDVTVQPGYTSSVFALGARSRPPTWSQVSVRGTVGILETLGDQNALRYRLTWSEVPGIWASASAFRVAREDFVAMVQRLHHTTIDEWTTFADRAGATHPYGPTGNAVEVGSGRLDDGSSWRVRVRAYRTPNGGYADEVCVDVAHATPPSTAPHHSCRTARPDATPLHWLHQIPLDDNRMAFGATGPDVAAVRLDFENSPSIVAETIPGFTTADARWWATPHPSGALLRQLTALDADRRELGHLADPRTGFRPR